MKLTISVSLDNAAFRDSNDHIDKEAVVEQVHSIAESIYRWSEHGEGRDGLHPGHTRSIFAINGSRVGSWKITDQQEDSD